MRELLQGLLPRILPEGVHFRLVSHEGKTDLERSIPRKLRAWKVPGVRFVVVRDKDSADCKLLKARLARLCAEAGRPDTLIRIVCPHLEAWFLGDLTALEEAYGFQGLAGLERRKPYRDPDGLGNAEEELKRLVPRYQKVSGARAIAPHLVPNRNRSHSFQVFLSGLARLVSPRET